MQSQRRGRRTQTSMRSTKKGLRPTQEWLQERYLGWWWQGWK
jgi:hypothetical protein